MMHTLKSKRQIRKLFQSRRAVAMLGLAFLMAFWPVSMAVAVNYDQQIQQLEGEAARYTDEANKKKAEADTLQNAVAALDAQVAAIKNEISANEVKLQQVNEKIVETEKRIENQRQALSLNLRSMYVESDVTPLEMVASSKSIGDFVDKQEYRNKIRDTIQKAITEIKQLKAELDQQKQQVEAILRDQKARRDQIAAQEAEKAKLLEQTRGEEQSYQKLSAEKKAAADDLREQQRRANSRFIGGGSYVGTGSYPWAGAGGDNWYWLDCYGPDPWGMCLRQCVSYTAWKVASTGRDVPYGLGNANQWDDNAAAAGIPVDGTPRAGDVAVSNTGAYGHVMYVESVNANGTINISQYNADYNGRYSTNTISPAGLRFIHF